MGNALIYVGIAVGVAAMAGAIIYGTENQKNYIPEDAVLQSQADEGLLEKTGSLGADLNKEQWYEDPYAEKAAEIREKFESGQ
jgi:hypothetical protein